MNFKNYIFILLIFILILPNIHSAVADLSFSIDNDGLVTVSGVTDYPSVLLPNDTYAYTTKNSQYWVFDINYPATFYNVKSRSYIETISKTLPNTEKTADIFNVIYQYLENSIDTEKFI